MNTRKTSIKLLMLSAGFAAMAAPAFAQAPNPNDETETVLITGSRSVMGTRTDLLGSSYTILAPVDLRNRQTVIVSDILRDIPGLAVSRTGNVGQLTQVRMRGGEGNHTYVMIDGIEASDPFAGEFDFATLLADGAARIEVLRGQQSALYGSNAMGGIVHYITLTGREAPGVQARIEGGSFDTLSGSARVGGVSGPLDYVLSATASRTGGSIGARGGIRHNAAENTAMSGKFIYTIMDNLSVTAVGRYSTTEADTTPQAFPFPATAQYGLTYDRLLTNPAVQVGNYYSSKSMYGLVRGDLELMEGAWTHSLTLQGVAGELKSYGDSAVLGYNGYGTRQKISYATTANFDTGMVSNAVTAAVDYKQETYRNKAVSGVPTVSNAERVLDNTGFVGQYDGRIGDQFGFGAAVRHDMNDRFKDATTYRVQASYRVIPMVSLRAAAGSGITNPTNYELFGFNPLTFQGNPNLRPEKSEGWEAGIDITPFEGVSAGATYFSAELTDEIFTAFVGPSVTATPDNRATKSTQDGVELWVQARLDEQWRVDANWTNIHALESSPGLQEVRRPPNTASLNVAWRAIGDAFGANLTIRYQSEQRDFQFTPVATLRVPLKAVTLVNFGADYRLNQTWQFYGRVENLLDTKYEEVFAFPAPGRAFYVGIRAQFN